MEEEEEEEEEEGYRCISLRCIPPGVPGLSDHLSDIQGNEGIIS